MKRVLVVDDDQAVLDMLEEMLPALGFEADFARGGCQAIKLLEEGHYDLVLSDVRMPRINGIDVARSVSKKRPGTPILFMSGQPNVLVEEQSFLAKPFTTADLEIRLDMLLGSPY